jgi:aromatic ring hydroxylase-like protein
MAAAAGYEDRLIVVSGKASDTHLRALLVRPDGVVAHASESASGDVEKHLALWLGEPAR